MSVSVIIPVRNGAAFIAEALGSVLAQSHIDHLIVIDDGSSDGTADIVKSVSDLRLSLIEGPARGVSAARNCGFARARTLAPRSPWIMFLDADDRLQPGAIANLLTATDDHCSAVYGDYERIDDQGRQLGHRSWMHFRSKPSGMILPQLLHGNFIVNGGVMLIRSDAFAQIDGYDESLRYCEDWHAVCRLATVGPILYRTKLHVLDYRVHTSSAMMHKSMTLQDYQPALDRIYSDPMILAKLSQGELARWRKAAEAQLCTYLACQEIRAGHYGQATSQALRALALAPGRSPQAFLRLAGATIGL